MVFCKICEMGKVPSKDSIVQCVCQKCLDAKFVTTFCRNCRMHHKYSLREGRLIFSLCGLNITRTGLLLFFETCLECTGEKAKQPQVILLQNQDNQIIYHPMHAFA